MHVGNRSPVRVKTLAMSIRVHDVEGVLVRQVSVLAMPPVPRATTVATFPWCADTHGRRLDGHLAAVAGRRVGVPLGF